MPDYTADYYRSNYPNYLAQNPRRKLAFYRHMVETNAGPHLPRRIHDIGCAFGYFLGSLDAAWTKFGSDLSRHAIEHARAVCPEGCFDVADGNTAPAFCGPFGVVTAFDVLEHIPDLDAAAASVNGQLAPGGTFIFVVPVYDGLSGPVIRFLDHDPTHVHVWPRGQWLAWATKHFSIVSWTGILRYLLPGGRLYVHYPTELWKRHVPAILVVCRRT